MELHMTGVTEYLTRFRGVSEDLFTYEVTVGGKLVAYVLASMKPSGWIVRDMYVQPDHEDRDLASLLLSLAKGRAQSLGWGAQLIAEVEK